MNEDKIEQSIKSPRYTHHTWMWVIVIITTASVVGGVVYTVQGLQLQSEQTKLQRQITLLQNQIEQLQETQQAAQPLTQQATNQEDQPVTQQATNQEDQPVDQPQSIVYNNVELGFSLTFPRTWNGYTVDNRTATWGSFGDFDAVPIGFEAQESLIIINRHSKDQWQKMASTGDPIPTYLGENDLYVFAYSSAQDAADDTLIARVAEVPDIIRTFKIDR